jgi:hypothetical protein
MSHPTRPHMSIQVPTAPVPTRGSASSMISLPETVSTRFWSEAIAVGHTWWAQDPQAPQDSWVDTHQTPSLRFQRASAQTAQSVRTSTHLGSSSRSARALVDNVSLECTSHSNFWTMQNWARVCLLIVPGLFSRPVASLL